MKTCEYAGAALSEPRSHPWLDTVANPDARYYDFRAEPALIRSSLEDFLPWSRYAAVDDFYRLLERLNHTSSALESNDCAFTGPEPNESPELAKKLQCSGRVMVLFHALEQNRSEPIEQLKNDLHQGLAELDPRFEWGVIGTTIVPVSYRALPAGDQLGCQLMISFWAWGDTEAESMSNFARVLKNLSRALKQLS